MRREFLTAVLVFTLTTVAWARDADNGDDVQDSSGNEKPSAASRVDRLERTVRQLRAENAALRARLAELGDEPDNQNAPHDVNDDDAGGDSGDEDASDGSRTDDADIERSAVKVSSVSALLRRLPEDLRLRPEGWDKFTYPKATAWLAHNAVGVRYSTRLPIRQIRVAQEPGSPPGKGWAVFLEFGGTSNQQGGGGASDQILEVFRIGGMRNRARLSGKLATSFACSEAIAQEWERRSRSPAFVTSSGIITRLEVSPNPEGGRRGGYQFELELRDRTLVLPYARNREGDREYAMPDEEAVDAAPATARSRPRPNLPPGADADAAGQGANAN